MSGGALLVREAGLLTTVQDLGRPGWGALGVPPAGALDPEALRIANLLAGNGEGAAGLEITVVGPVLSAIGDVDLAVAGGAFGPVPGRVVRLRDGDTVPLRAAEAGRGPARAAVAVSGGIDVPELLGSRSTCVAARFGGLHGGPLRKGDLLPVGRSRRAPRLDAVAPELPSGDEIILRVLPGPQAHLFGDEAVRTFYGEAFRLGPDSNRIGFRLEGAAVRGDLAAIEALPSEGTALGSVQITADGQPIVLLAERPTTGGYPKIATVARADLGLLVRARPGATIRFAPTTPGEARRLLLERDERIGRFARWLAQ
ncbi:MAG TPA: biotin-dependent carboxyltransferase family protein [Thermoanaerobaculia bacterium]|nr:biotin-dependent carboxyltransferase family protein [Thermoanaerobaculia bacterium]